MVLQKTLFFGLGLFYASLLQAPVLEKRMAHRSRPPIQTMGSVPDLEDNQALSKITQTEPVPSCCGSSFCKFKCCKFGCSCCIFYCLYFAVCGVPEEPAFIVKGNL